MSKCIYTVTAGGLGDTIYNYLSPNFDTSYFASIKKYDHSCLTKVYVWSSNSQSAELLLHDPNIDHVEFHAFNSNWYEITLSLSSGYRTLTAEEKNYLINPPVIHLDQEESSIAKQIENNGPFVVIHPFAGTGEKSWSGNIDILNVINILKKCHFQIVLVGGSSIRHGENRFIEESISLEDEQVHNLINKYSSRLHAYLSNHANIFIGSVSAYSVAAAAGGVKSLLFGPEHSQKELLFGSGPFELFRKNSTAILPWNNYNIAVEKFISI